MNGQQNNPPSDQTPRPPAPVTPEDAGSQALAEALRSSFGLIKFVMVALVVIFLGSGFFTVGPQEKAIILRLGKPVGEGDKMLLGTGLHWSFPYPVDEVRKVPITEIQRVSSTVGWYATTPEQELAGTEPQPGPSLNPAVDGFALTADENIIHTRAVAYYRINDPVRYIFGFVNASNAVQDALDNALLFASARFKVDDILTRDVAGFRDAVRRRVTELVERQAVGVVIERCDVDRRPPRYLKKDFDEVLEAELKRSTVLNDARSYENQVLIRAGADAAARVNAAETERTNLVASVAAEAQRFQDLLPKFNSNPALFVQQRLTETISRVMNNAQDKIFLPERADGKTRQLRLLLNREPQKPKAETPTNP